jgi:hypothetical protein
LNFLFAAAFKGLIGLNIYTPYGCNYTFFLIGIPLNALPIGFLKPPGAFFFF